MSYDTTRMGMNSPYVPLTVDNSVIARAFSCAISGKNNADSVVP